MEFIFMILAYLEQEAAVVGVICAIFLILFVVAGVRQILKDKE
jgi:hypothetical protein